MATEFTRALGFSHQKIVHSNACVWGSLENCTEVLIDLQVCETYIVSPQPPGQRFQCLTTLTENNFFLISIWNIPWHNWRQSPRILSVTWEKRLLPTSPWPPLRELWRAITSLLGLSKEKEALQRSRGLPAGQGMSLTWSQYLLGALGKKRLRDSLDLFSTVLEKPVLSSTTPCNSLCLVFPVLNTEILSCYSMLAPPPTFSLSEQIQQSVMVQATEI